MIRTRGRASRARTLLAGSLVAGALLVPLSVATPPAAALSNTPFCKAIFNWAYHPVAAPTSMTIAGYHKWVGELLPYYERIEATAPNAKDKQILGFIVTVLKTYSKDSSFATLTAYQKLHKAQFNADVKVLTASIRACATG